MRRERERESERNVSSYQIIDYEYAFVGFGVGEQGSAGVLGQSHHLFGRTEIDQRFGQRNNLFPRDLIDVVRQLLQLLGSHRERVRALTNKRLFSSLKMKRNGKRDAFSNGSVSKSDRKQLSNLALN